MPIQATDIVCRLSGGASNASAAASLGGAKSSAPAPQKLFDDVIPADASTVEYRCVYVHNAHATLTALGVKAYVPSNTPSTSTAIEIGVGTSAVNGTEQTVTNERTAPTGVTFGPAATLASAMDMGDIPPGQSRALWLRRTVSAVVVALASDPITLRFNGDTLA